ncbi:phytanoyl-CoA dioxygenase family protein [Ferruginivarius sediminum]|uniref:Phytanoyl-CoA dioxygenase family protein n=1 Tax=Ferruginivarius sediminum TaxID=2661937 RepID=A0A369T8Y2_9PROT|nr:phytanoyl-CoA dioxygenase family protein [Ferruginivarius sediminum]RDD60934.1 phytanoyl-CoA dioxygenase family protein [Ferruginivarius sediminum]
MPDTSAPVSPKPHVQALTESQIAEYDEQGFIIARGILPADLLQELQDVTSALWEKGRQISGSDNYYDIAPGHTAETPLIRRISRPTELHDVYVKTAFDSVVGDLAADLLGGAVKFYHSKINFKLPGSKASDVQWHQDWPHFPHTNFDLLAVSVPMHARTRDNGCIKAVPGSHRRGPLSTWRDGTYVFTCEDSMTLDDFANAVDLEAEPGDVIIHHGLAVHGSKPNPTDSLVTTLTIQYAAADAFAFTAPVIDSIHRNAMVRGEPASHARLVAGDIELPPDFSGGYKSLFASQDEAKR